MKGLAMQEVVYTETLGGVPRYWIHTRDTSARGSVDISFAMMRKIIRQGGRLVRLNG